MTAIPKPPIRLHRFVLSGHAHRAELFLSLLGLPYETVEIDLAHGAQKRPEFLALNPFGKVPVIEDDGAVIADSQAILVYLALRYDTSGRWLPREPLAAAQVQQWLVQAAGPLASGAAAARWLALTGKPVPPALVDTASTLLRQMEAHLSGRDWLVGSLPNSSRCASGMKLRIRRGPMPSACARTPARCCTAVSPAWKGFAMAAPVSPAPCGTRPRARRRAAGR